MIIIIISIIIGIAAFVIYKRQSNTKMSNLKDESIIDIYDETTDVIIRQGKLIDVPEVPGMKIRMGRSEVRDSRTMFVSNRNGSLRRVPLASVQQSRHCILPISDHHNRSHQENLSPSPRPKKQQRIDIDLNIQPNNPLIPQINQSNNVNNMIDEVYEFNIPNGTYIKCNNSILIGPVTYKKQNKSVHLTTRMSIKGFADAYAESMAQCLYPTIIEWKPTTKNEQIAYDYCVATN